VNPLVVAVSVSVSVVRVVVVSAGKIIMLVRCHEEIGDVWEGGDGWEGDSLAVVVTESVVVSVVVVSWRRTRFALLCTRPSATESPGSRVLTRSRAVILMMLEVAVRRRTSE